MSSSSLNKGLISFIACFAVFAVFAESQECSDYCEDYHLICPGVKDPNFYENYVTMHENKELEHFQDGPLPPSPDCSNVFYQLACPYSCGTCTRCECCDKDDPNKKQSECNPCTEVKQIIRDDVFICKPRYELVPEPVGPCSCYCGTGTVEVEMLCKTFYEASDGSCFEEITDASKCGNNDSNTRGTQSCKDRDCEVTKIIEQTLPVELAGLEKNQPIHYKGTTEDGQTCDIGDLGGQKRPRGGKTTWDLQVKCDVCLKSEEEGFRNLTLSNDHEQDAWDPESLTVTFNGNSQTFEARYPIDRYPGKNLKKGKQIPFITTEEFDQLYDAGEI